MDQTERQLEPLEEDCRYLKERNMHLEKEVQFLKYEKQELKDEMLTLKVVTNSVVPPRESITARRKVLEGSYHAEIDRRAMSVRRITSATAGNILMDCFILKVIQQEDSTKLEKCRQRFDAMYGVESDMVRETLSAGSGHVILAYNYRANARFLRRWRLMAGEELYFAYKLEEICSQAIDRWETWVKDGKVNPEPILRELIKEARGLDFELRMIFG